MALQTQNLTLVGLGSAKDTPPNSEQPPLIDGIHLRHPCYEWPDHERQGEQALVAGSSPQCVDIGSGGQSKCPKCNRHRSVKCGCARRVPKSNVFEPNVSRTRCTYALPYKTKAKSTH